MNRWISKKRTGERIRSLLAERGLSVAEIQDKMELESPQAVYKWLHGISLPSIAHLHELSCILGVSIEEILAAEELESNEDVPETERE